MRSVVERAFEVAAATFPRAPRDGLSHPFGFDEHDRYEWRVSRDVWDQLVAYAGWPRQEPGSGDQLLGEPIRVDDSLPANAMLLEPMSAVRSAVAEVPEPSE